LRGNIFGDAFDIFMITLAYSAYEVITLKFLIKNINDWRTDRTVNPSLTNI